MNSIKVLKIDLCYQIGKFLNTNNNNKIHNIYDYDIYKIGNEMFNKYEEFPLISERRFRKYKYDKFKYNISFFDNDDMIEIYYKIIKK